MTRLILIRHAMTGMVGRLFAGRMTGVHLNDEGKLQAEKLSRRLANWPLAAIYSSPVERAVETANQIAERHHVPVETSADFTELDCGEWTGERFEEIEKSTAFQRFNIFRSFSRPPGGELMLQAQVRVIRGIEKIQESHRNKSVAIVSHADIVKSAIAYFAGLHLDMLQRIDISPASISIVELWEDSAQVVLMNDTAHL